MRIETLIPFLFVGIPVGIFLLANVFLWNNRKTAWRETALLMNAEYSGERLLLCGTIQGKCNGRSFRVAIRRIGGAGTGKHTCTWITVSLLNKGLMICLPSVFFDRRCDPAKAFKKIAFMEDMRVFVKNVKVKRIKTEALAPEEQVQLATALKGWNPRFSAHGNPVGRESVNVQHQEVVFSERNVITDVQRIKALVDLVTELANRIENSPVGQRDSVAYP